MTNNQGAEPAFSIPRTAYKWFRDSIHYRGVLATGREFGSRVFDFLRDLTPSRRRLRYGDLQFDFDHGVDTTWSNVGLPTRVREIFSGEQYQPIDPEQFHRIVEEVGIDYRDFTFIDLGSGKGRALLLASEYPFRRIIGVEILPELHVIAERNVARFSADRQKCRDIKCWCGDARRFEFPLEPTLLYLFNPFYEPVMKTVLLNLQDSLRGAPRTLLVLYTNPVSEHLLARVTGLSKIRGTQEYALYVFQQQ